MNWGDGPSVITIARPRRRIHWETDMDYSEQQYYALMREWTVDRLVEEIKVARDHAASLERQNAELERIIHRLKRHIDASEANRPERVRGQV